MNTKSTWALCHWTKSCMNSCYKIISPKKHSGTMLGKYIESANWPHNKDFASKIHDRAARIQQLILEHCSIWGKPIFNESLKSQPILRSVGQCHWTVKVMAIPPFNIRPSTGWPQHLIGTSRPVYNMLRNVNKLRLNAQPPCRLSLNPHRHTPKTTKRCTHLPTSFLAYHWNVSGPQETQFQK